MKPPTALLAPALIALTGAAAAASSEQLVINPKNRQNSAEASSAVPIDLSHLRNNRGFGREPGDADFDGAGNAYPAAYLPPEDLTYGGIRYVFPQYQKRGNDSSSSSSDGGHGYDNVLAEGQVLEVPRGRYSGAYMLAAAETAVATGLVNGTYDDGSASSRAVLVDPFWAWPYPYGGDIIFPYHLANASVDYNRSMIFQATAWLDSTRDLVGLQLPNVSSGSGNGPGGGAESTRLHIFALSLLPATVATAATEEGGKEEGGLALEVLFARSTNMWLEGTNKTQIVEVTVNNVGTGWIFSNHSVKVSIESSGLRTVKPGAIKRLRPGDQARVQIGVENSDGVAEGTPGEATIVISGAGVKSQYTFDATFGISQYDPTYDSIYQHETPPWFNDGKYGIFIHWGVYSVPGWGNSGDRESYAEWYWWRLNSGPGGSDQTWEYHRDTYGEDLGYDDFIPGFTASEFDPKEWVDLFAEAGAQYFVQVSKHHDGYALMDLPAHVSNRTSVALPPHRNLLQELFDAAAEHQPHLHQATYFSLPEWFHPDYKPLGFGSWPGGNATNPYTGEVLPYTGYVPVEDFIKDVILPEMETLANMGTEIMWCDIGGPNRTAEFAAEYFNSKARKGQQVLINNRCGVPGDFDTPEYARYSAVQRRKWESNLGMDPFSYGYNRATPDSAYLDPASIVTSLVDIVSKNGNFLLDIGPTANVLKRNLRQAGEWITTHAEAIFNTTYWYVTPEEGQAVRFTQTTEAFYIITLYAPNDTLVLQSPVPYVPGDQVTVVGGNASGTAVPSQLLDDGSLQLTISDEVKEADRYAWAFKIPFGPSD
ncbi:hypothetical protein SLS62_002871 [Diatrype stigma]|uniref:alpha-L-fucosidase n=1 Tax=Diatrype stigma TaxID=117547 RepID=A0AAN9UWX2_9PEZI